MGYHLQAVLAKAEALNHPALRRGPRKIVHLAQGVDMLLVTDVWLASLLPAREAEPALQGNSFLKLTDALAEAARLASASGIVTYVEAAMDGGSGEQRLVVWLRGKLVDGPLAGNCELINSALGWLDVVRGPTGDQFTTVGLDAHRRMEEWLAVARDE